MAEHKRLQRRMLCSGISLTHPVDMMPEGKFPILLNVRVAKTGEIQTRQGIAPINPVPMADGVGNTNVHSMRRMDNSVPGATFNFTRYAGVGHAVFSGNNAGQTTFVNREDGFSGNPLSMVPFRPDQSPEPWMYVGDSTKMRKFRGDGTPYRIGIAPPNQPPEPTLGIPAFSIMAGFNATSTGAQLPTAIVYDSGSVGWCSIAIGPNPDFTKGCLIYNSTTAENVIAHDVYNSLSQATALQILYDSGSSGTCCVQSSAALPGIKPDMVVSLSDGFVTEFVRVLSVNQGFDGLVSFRCSTTHTYGAGAQVLGWATLRLFTTSTWTNAHPLVRTYTTTTSPTPSITTVASQDMSNVIGRAMEGSDFIHFSIRISDLTEITEGRITFNLTGTGQYYYKTFRASDLQLNALNLQTATQASIIQAEQNALAQASNANPSGLSNFSAAGTNLNNPIYQKEILDAQARGMFYGVDVPYRTPYIDPSSELALGQSQWTSLSFKFGEFQRVGSDETQSWRDVTGWTITVNATASVTVDVADGWFGGGYGPDIGSAGQEFFYRYRARSKQTGAMSNPSPPTRAGVRPHRERVNITVMSACPDPQCDTLDIFRWGGGLTAWKYVGSVPNGVGATYFDDYAALDLVTAPTLSFDNYQPVPTIDLPRTGTCLTSGTLVEDTGGDNFNPSWAAGTQIIINTKPYTLYASPYSTSRLEVVENVGSLTDVEWSVPQATLLAYPPGNFAAGASVTLPFLWGPYGEGETGTAVFGCGEAFQPGVLYWLKSDNPDSAPDRNQLEVCSPAERLMNGCMYDTRSYVMSTRRLFQILPDGRGGFVSHEVPGNYGLVGKYALCAGPKIWYVGPDGIYETAGGPAVNITNEDLFPLFPHPGAKTETVNGLRPIDYDNHLDSLRLEYGNGYLFFDYVDTAGVPSALVFDVNRRIWVTDVYYGVGFMNAHHREEGQNAEQVDLCSTNGKIYYFTGTSDEGSQIYARVLTPSVDFGDSRPVKVWGDVMVDANADGTTINVQPSVNNNTGFGSAFTVVGSTRETSRTIADLGLPAGTGLLGRNIALDFSWSSSTASPALYEWQPAVLERPETTLKRAIDFTEDGYKGAKYFQGVVIEADTAGSTRTVSIDYYDDAGNLQSFTISVFQSGKFSKPYGFPTPFIASEVRLRPTDAASWQLFGIRWIWVKKPDLAQITTDWTDADFFGAKYIQGVVIEADTRSETGTPQAVSVDVLIDGATFTTLTCNHNGQLEIPYSFSSTIIGHEMKLVPHATLRVFKYAFIFTKKPEYFALIQDWTDDGHPGVKLVQAAYFEVDTQGQNVNVEIFADGASQVTITLNSSTQSIIPYSFYPFLAHLVKVIPRGNLRFFRVNWVWVKKPELFNFQDDWTDCNEFKDKLFQGVMIEADTVSQNVVLNVWKDGNMTTPAATLIVNHNGQVEKPYAFTSTFFAHTVKITPSITGGGNPLRQFKYAFIYQTQPENFALINDWSDTGYVGSKYFQGCVIEADTGNQIVLVDVQTDSGTVLQTLSCQFNGRVEIAYAFNPAVIKTEIRLVPHGNWRLYNVRWLKVEKPEFAAFWQDWTDDGYIGAKFMQGCVIEADTEGAPITVQVQYDGGTVGATLTVNQSGQTAQAYSFDPVFIAHTLRLVPQGNWRFFKVKWVWEPEPELAKSWETQGTTHDMSAYGHIRAGWVTLISTADVTLAITVDGVTYNYLLASTAGAHLKRYFVANPVKGKITAYKLTSTQPFRVFAKDTAILVKAWGDPGGYRPVSPFGDISRVAGARI